MRQLVSVRRLVLLVALLGALLVVAAPASASNFTPTGTRISLFSPPQGFAANTPFYVRHGFLCPVPAGSKAGACQLGLYNFSLYVDNVLQPSTKTVTYQNGIIAELWWTNFPNGLPAGEHTLTGVWTFKGALFQPPISITIPFS
jgi:hypothetical protein